MQLSLLAIITSTVFATTGSARGVFCSAHDDYSDCDAHRTNKGFTDGSCTYCGGTYDETKQLYCQGTIDQVLCVAKRCDDAFMKHCWEPIPPPSVSVMAICIDASVAAF